MSEIHDLVYHGGGGFIYSEVWMMPVMTRKLHIRKINKFLQDRAEAEEKAMKGSSSSVDPKSLNVPDFVSKIKK